MLVLHIGPHKTATTYLQSNFTRQRAALKRSGWLYPAIGVRVGLAHHDIAENSKQFRRSAGPMFETVRSVARKAKAGDLGVLLSAEGFRSWRPKEIAGLTGLFAPEQVRVVYVLRDPFAVIRSMWSQAVKVGATTKSLPQFLARHLDNAGRSRALNPLRDLDAWLKLPGAEFRILLYDELERRDLDIYSTFMSEALGIDDARPTSAVANARAPLELTEFIRLLSIASGYRSEPGRLDIGDAVRLLFSPEERNAIVETIRTHGAVARRTIDVASGSDRFDALERELRRAVEPHFRPRLDERPLFSAAHEAWSFYDTDSLMQVPEVRALLERSSRRIRPGAVVLGVMNSGMRAIAASRRLRNRVLRA